ncbi:MAG: anti-sigma factor [Actinomycetota bacterium]|nr:anti-sigma factor [Actinomycetota bacterium]
MKPEADHREIQDLLGAYALDAVELTERAAIEAHLAECPMCRAEVAEHLETAAMLAASGGQAPEGVWDRIDGALEGPHDEPVTLRRRRTPARWLTAAAVVVAIGAVVSLSVGVIQQRERIEELAATTEEATLARAANAALLHPDGRRFRLTSPAGTEVDAVLLPNGTGYIVSDNLPPLPSTRTYQLWALGEEDPISAGVLGPNPAVLAFSASPGASGLAITEEVAGGVVTPESDPIAVAESAVTS